MTTRSIRRSLLSVSAAGIKRLRPKMRAIACLLIMAVCGCMRADRFATPTAKNSVPRDLWIEYSEPGGVDFRLQHFTPDRNPTGRIVTGYVINWRRDENAKWHDVEVTPEEWIRFRQALKDAGCEKLPDRGFDPNAVKAFWSIQIVYPDVTIRASAADVPSLQSDFAPIRKAVRELTAGAIK